MAATVTLPQIENTNSHKKQPSWLHFTQFQHFSIFSLSAALIRAKRQAAHAGELPRRLRTGFYNNRK